MNCKQENIANTLFKLVPVFEEIGKESSKDGYMKNAVLKCNHIDNEYKSYLETIRLMSAGKSHYPLWIKLSKLDNNLIEITFSTRFRHLKTCHNQETGHPPFELIN